MLKPVKGKPGCFHDTKTGHTLNIAEFREGDKYCEIIIPKPPKCFWLFRLIGQWLCTFSEKLHIWGSRLQGYDDE